MNKFLLGAILLLAIAFVAWLLFSGDETQGKYDAFAQCLAQKEVTMYGADRCSHCQNEKKAFGESFRFVPYVECPDDPQRCLEEGIEGYPTWVFPASSAGGPEGKKLVGEQGLEKLSQESGCQLPQ